MTPSYDTIIVGGGPAGSTAGTLLKKYAPDHRVLILERERFPRDHVGESQLPLIMSILDEMGVWGKIEAADFPIKVGATYRWGATQDLWNFNFLPHGEMSPEPRPGKFSGQRVQTAFQVDRSIYDEILLDHAAEMGCEVRQETRVVEVLREGDRVTGLRLESREVVTARHYVDATGGSGLIRRAMEVEVDYPSTLRNIAIWDYWQNADWAEEIGVGGTRIQVLSLGYGWIWFIPLGPTRTSVGLVIPAEYYKQSGQRPAELYAKALDEEERVKALMTHAVSEGKLQTTNDWSYVADRLYGENWFLVGDSCGFADPILSAGMTLAHGGGREVAYMILELDRGDLDPTWLKSGYEDMARRRIRQHIRFADYWYTANGCFTDLKEFTTQIAKDAGLELDPDKAFQWLGTGGFASDSFGLPTVGGYNFRVVKQIAQRFSGQPVDWELNRYNVLQLDMAGVTKEERPVFWDGRIQRATTYVKDGHVLPLVGPFRYAVAALQRERDLEAILRFLKNSVGHEKVPGAAFLSSLTALEALLIEGWVKGKVDKRRPVGLGLTVENDSASLETARPHEPPLPA